MDGFINLWYLLCLVFVSGGSEEIKVLNDDLIIARREDVPTARILGAGNVFLRAGKSINLTCLIDRTPNPPLFVFWYHNSNLLNYRLNLEISPIHMIGSDSASTRLFIPNTQVSDSGNYTCSPANAPETSVMVHVLNGGVNDTTEKEERKRDNDGRKFNGTDKCNCDSEAILPKGCGPVVPREFNCHLLNCFFNYIEKRRQALDERIVIPVSAALKEELEITHVEVENVGQVEIEGKEVQSENCADVKSDNKDAPSGVYRVKPRVLDSPIEVYCDMDTIGGGWTVFQRRMPVRNNRDYFLREFIAYKNGFGDLEKEFWIGNDNLNALTRGNVNELRLEMEDFENNTKYAIYDNFEVDDAVNRYKLSIGAYNSGDAGDDLLTSCEGADFRTYEKYMDGQIDRQISSTGGIICDMSLQGGWWVHRGNCSKINLNGLYLRGHHPKAYTGVNVAQFRGNNYSLKSTEMKFRPKDFLSGNY